LKLDVAAVVPVKTVARMGLAVGMAAPPSLSADENDIAVWSGVYGRDYEPKVNRPLQSDISGGHFHFCCVVNDASPWICAVRGFTLDLSPILETTGYDSFFSG
jgi:hypothetical protein